MNKQTALLQEFWRRAAQQGEIAMELPSAKEAVRMRFMLYGAVRKVRETPELDPELAEAVFDTMITIEGGTTLKIISLRNLPDYLHKIAEENGISTAGLVAAPRNRAEKEARDLELSLLNRLANRANNVPDVTTEELPMRRNPRYD